MFGIGGSEIIVILIVALLFLGPDKLPDAARTISKGIRDLKKQSRALQQQIEDDEHIGGAIRDLKSALRGDEAPVRPKPAKKALAPPENTIMAPADAAATTPDPHDGLEPPKPVEAAAEPKPGTVTSERAATSEPEAPAPAVRLPPTAGEKDPDSSDNPDDARELGAMIRPASGTVAHAAKSSKPEREHG